MFDLSKAKLEVHYKNSFASTRIADFLSEHLTEDTAIVCIGTDKCIVDSLGPLVGTFLSKQDISIDVYGTLDNPVHAMNINEHLKAINKRKYSNIIAIDACLSNKKNQGIIEVREGSITPGKGIGKLLPEIGDYSIIGIIDTSDKEFHDLIQDTRLSTVYSMAEVISAGIVNALTLKSKSFLEEVSIGM